MCNRGRNRWRGDDVAVPMRAAFVRSDRGFVLGSISFSTSGPLDVAAVVYFDAAQGTTRGRIEDSRCDLALGPVRAIDE